jgi:hypothetical protein
VEAQTCDLPLNNPTFKRLPRNDSLGLQWSSSGSNPAACEVKDFQLAYQQRFEEPTTNDSLWGIQDATGMVLGKTLFSELIPSSVQEYNVMDLIGGEVYRFKLRTSLASGWYESGWTNTTVAGVPDEVDAPINDALYASRNSIALAWMPPDMNFGDPVGYEVFRNDGTGGPISLVPDPTCKGAINSTCTTDCVYGHSSRVPHMVGCSVTDLADLAVYEFRVRAINEYGPGPLSSVVQFPTGAQPFAYPPTLNLSSPENCSMTWLWPPALERGLMPLKYELLLQDCNDGLQEAVFSYNASASTMNHTVDMTDWDLLSVAVPFKAKVRAVTSVGGSFWSEWSPCHHCFSSPPRPTPPRRDAMTPPRAGVITVRWDPVVDASQTGGGDPKNGDVYYELFGHPSAAPPEKHWRHLALFATHDSSGAANPPSFRVITYPETPRGSNWTFRYRVRNSVHASEMSDQVVLGSASLPSAPRNLTSSFNPAGRLRLAWLPPYDSGGTSLSRYEVRCVPNMEAWEHVPSQRLSHTLGGLPTGPSFCSARAVNSAGNSTAVNLTVLILQFIA